MATILQTEQKYAFAYLRVSTEEQTVQNQRLVLASYAKQHGYEILSFFEDSAVSGSIPALERKGFKDMVELVRGEKVDAVFVYELSRVGRTFWDTLEAIKAVEQYAPLISCSPKESFLQTDDLSVRKLLIGILTWVAERERDNLIQRTKDGLERARAEGKHIGRARIEIPADVLLRIALDRTARDIIAKELGISKVTLYSRLHELEMVKGLQLVRHCGKRIK